MQQHQEYSQQPLQHQFIQQQQQFPQQQFYQHDNVYGHNYNNYIPSSHQGGISWPGALPSSSSVGSQHPSILFIIFLPSLTVV